MTITIDTVGNSYVLRGDIASIKEKRRAQSNFKSIGAVFDVENQISIPFSTEEQPSQYDNREEQYQAVLRLCEKFGINLSRTEGTARFVEDIEKENKNFREFSRKAKDIRNDIHEGNNFQSFADAVSEHLVRKLYPMQLLSAYHLAFSQNACNFSVPGAGKTSIVYAAYAYLRNLPEEDVKHVNKMLIISPLSAFGPWEDEYKECFGCAPSIKKLAGVSQKDRRSHFYSGEHVEVTLVSYQSASRKSDVESITHFLKRDGNKVMVILDEAHRIKNVDGGKWAEAILSIAKYASSRIVLTGTPAPNGCQDLYNLYKFIWPNKDVIGFPVSYLRGLAESHTPKSQQDIRELIDRISPFFIRIKKSHLQLPNLVNNEPIPIPMSQSQREIYEYIERKYIDYFEQEVNENGFLSRLRRAKLIRLMQCITNPKLLSAALDDYLDEGLSPDLGIDDRSVIELIKSDELQKEVPPKFIALASLLKSLIYKKGPDGRVVVWAIFIQTIIDLQVYLKSQGIECELLYGATPNEDEGDSDILTRQKIIKRFHEPDCPYKVIIANPFAVGESISLHKACHNAVYLEKNFNAAMYVQSKDRIHRYGLAESDEVNCYYLLSKDSIDETIHRRLLEKEETMLEIIESEEIPLLLNIDMDGSEDDMDDIKAIIQDYHARKTVASQ